MRPEDKDKLVNLPDTVKTFLEVVAEDQSVGGEYAGRYLPFFSLTPGEAQQKARSYLDDLVKFQVGPDTALDPGVKAGWAALQALVDNNPFLGANQATLFTYGSIQYDDPHFLDYDLFLVTQKQNVIVEAMTKDIDRQIKEGWPGSKESSPVAYSSLDSIETLSQEILNGDLQWIRANVHHIERDAEYLAIIASGYALNRQDLDLLKAVQDRTWSIAFSSPLLSGPFCALLYSSLIERWKRRNLPILQP